MKCIHNALIMHVKSKWPALGNYLIVHMNILNYVHIYQFINYWQSQIAFIPFFAKHLNLFCGFLFLQRGILPPGGGNAAGGRNGRINGRGKLTRQPGCLDNGGLDDKGLRGKDSSSSSFIYQSNHLHPSFLPPIHPSLAIHLNIPKIILGIILVQIIYEMLLDLSKEFKFVTLCDLTFTKWIVRYMTVRLNLIKKEWDIHVLGLLWFLYFVVSLLN